MSDNINYPSCAILFSKLCLLALQAKMMNNQVNKHEGAFAPTVRIILNL